MVCVFDPDLVPARNPHDISRDGPPTPITSDRQAMNDAGFEISLCNVWNQESLRRKISWFVNAPGPIALVAVRRKTIQLSLFSF
jgi:hypothetical protein